MEVHLKDSDRVLTGSAQLVPELRPGVSAGSRCLFLWALVEEDKAAGTLSSGCQLMEVCEEFVETITRIKCLSLCKSDANIMQML